MFIIVFYLHLYMPPLPLIFILIFLSYIFTLYVIFRLLRLFFFPSASFRFLITILVLKFFPSIFSLRHVSHFTLTPHHSRPVTFPLLLSRLPSFSFYLFFHCFSCLSSSSPPPFPFLPSRRSSSLSPLWLSSPAKGRLYVNLISMAASVMILQSDRVLQGNNRTRKDCLV